MTKAIKVAVTKGGGPVALALLPRVAAGEMFGPSRRVAMSLVDRPGSVPLEQVIAGALGGVEPTVLDEVRAGADPHRALEGADWVVLIDTPRPRPEPAASVTWADGPAYTAWGRAINAACPNARILVAAYPSNLHAMIARAHAQDVPPGHWFALTRHIEDDAAELVAAKAGRPGARVDQLVVYGRTGPKAFVDLHHARIDGHPAPEAIARGDWAHHEFETALRDRVREHVAGRSSPSAVARAIAATIHDLTTPTPPHRWFNVSVESDGSYGVPRGLICGFPVRTDENLDQTIVHHLYLDAHAHRRVAENVAALEFDAVEMSV
jgi:malate dehydrogenase